MFSIIPITFNNQTQSFSTIKLPHYHKIPKKIPKSPNKISCITNITYLTSNNKIYNFFLKKKTSNKSFRVKSPTTDPTIQPLKMKFDTDKCFSCLAEYSSKISCEIELIWPSKSPDEGQQCFIPYTPRLTTTPPLFSLSPFFFHFLLFKTSQPL